MLCVVSDSLAQSTVCSYKYRKRITFDPTKVSGPVDLINFPVLINITSDNDLRTLANAGHVENANGFDIVFTDANGVTLLSHQLEKYTATTGEMIAWVKIPNLSTTYNTFIYMYYGNPAITTDQSSTNTWDANYMAVYHMSGNENNGTGTAGLNGTNNGTAGGTGQIGNARDFERNNPDYVNVTPYNAAYDLTNDITVSAWVRLESLGNDQKIAGNQNNANGGWKFGVFTDNKVEFEIRTAGNAPSLNRNGWCGLCGGGTALVANQWYYVVGQYSNAGDFIQCYVNGGVERQFTGNTTACGTSNGTMKFGCEPFTTNAANFDGIIDEIHISNSIRSADWIATEYNNQNSPNTFYSISAEPNVWTGGTSTNYNVNTNWLNNSAPTAGNDVIINNGAFQPSLQNNEQVGSMWIKTGAVLTLGTNSLSVRYDVTNCGTLSNNTGTVHCNSTAAFCQTQYFSGSGTFNLKSLSLFNNHPTSPSLSLCAAVTVNGTLALSNGVIYSSSTNLLSLSNTAVSTSGSAGSFVSGPIRKTGNTTFVFPIGKGTKWRRCEVSNISVSDSYTAEYFNTPYTSTSPVNAPLTNVSLVEYWQVDRAGAGNAQLRLYWEDASQSGITNCPQLTIARWNGASWDERPGTASGSCSGTGTGSILTNAQLTAFSPFTFGSKGFSNPLPVSLVSFTATPVNKNKVLIEWNTASESNNDHFDVERSTDGVNFELVGKEKGKGNPHKASAYSMYDHKPHKGQSYYRLRQVDLNGQETFSPLAPVLLDETTGEELLYNLFPNPTAGEFTLEGDVDGAEVMIYNTLGQQVKYIVRSRTAGDIQFDCNAFAKGVYFIHIKLNDQTRMQKLVIE
jgi:hypothetical protein